VAAYYRAERAFKKRVAAEEREAAKENDGATDEN
jgi:hypothetical protein